MSGAVYVVYLRPDLSTAAGRVDGTKSQCLCKKIRHLYYIEMRISVERIYEFGDEERE